MNTRTPQPTRRADYRPPAHSITHIALEFDLDAEETRVRATLETRRNTDHGAPLILDGEDLTLDSVRLNGARLSAGDYRLTPDSLTLPDPGRTGIVELATRCRPRDNTRLEGLYISNGVFCTQCEAEGFRRITWFTDRPDNLAVYTVTLIARRPDAPILLSNGNLIATCDLGQGRHMARWHDPFPKPSYLFALVAGDLAAVGDHFTTASGREVALNIYVEHGNESRCAFALEALKRAMRWDEETYGLEYDLECFNIVAVSDFNMGAMENKSLNIFNAQYILADTETATDDDHALIEAVVAHEYFHNWTGNRITCRDWFQLSLKEGLTVFRDRQFSADRTSPAVQRIRDVRALRARQFTEDGGPLAHPVRPDSYIEINNFYTATVYEKGAEVVRMLHTLLGADGFRRGMDTYIARHDGEAATCDQFVAAMADANGRDLTHFMRWYAQSGTPEIEISSAADANTGHFDLTISQRTPPTPDQPDKLPLHMPFEIALLNRTGKPLPLRLEGEPEQPPGPRTLELTADTQSFRFAGDFVGAGTPNAMPVLSLNRGFSAPVRLKTRRSDDDLAFLMARDTDPFNRWEAGQQLASRLLLTVTEDLRAGGSLPSPAAWNSYIEALHGTIARADEDRALCAEALRLPGLDELADLMPVSDFDAVHRTREALRAATTAALHAEFEALYDANGSHNPQSADAEHAARRALRNQALFYLAKTPGQHARQRVVEHYNNARNMTDCMAALTLLADDTGPARDAALADFHDRFRERPLVIDKWFALQARSHRSDTLARVTELLHHRAFSFTNPNRVRALIGGFAMGNPLRFHASTGEGYRFLSEHVLALDGCNPQLAARLMTPFSRWRRFDEARRGVMRAALEQIRAAPGLSPDLHEITAKLLA